MATITPFIAITNHSTILSDAEVANAVHAFQTATTYKFRRYWDAGASIHYMPTGSTMPTGSWVFAITDTSDEAGALAYHDVNGEDVPTASIFAKTERDYGASWTVSLTHELWEALADPELGACFQISNTQLIALEVCDPVEADRYAFTEPGQDGSLVLISAFVTRNWFILGAPGPYAYPNGILSKPLELAPGGYVSIATATSSGIQWSQKQMRNGELVDADDNPYEDPDDGPMRRVRHRA